MGIILNIETATEICSVALYRGEALLSLQESSEAYRHTGQLTLLIQSAFEFAGLSMKELDAVALSAGPGSYTALRVGAATAKGICYALDKPLIAVDTLQALALAAAVAHPGYTYYCPMIDARRMEVYTALFDRQNVKVGDLRSLIVEDGAFAEYQEAGQNILFCGNGAEKCRAVLSTENATFIALPCSAKYLAPFSLGAYLGKEFSDIAYFEPTYLKPPNITKPKKLL